MDRFYPPHGLPSDSVPFGRGVLEVARQTVAPPVSVSDGVRLDPSHHRDPCSAIGNWTSSSSNSPGEPMSLSHHQQNPWKMTLPPSLPVPTSLSERGLPRLLPSHRLEAPEGPSTLLGAGGPRSRQLKPGLRRLYDSKPPLDWLREPGAIPSCSHESNSYHISSGMARSDTSETACPTASLPPLSPAVSALTYPSLKLDQSDSSDNIDDKPYSKLIEMALKTNPEKKLSLQGIYNWFEHNTAKGRDHSSKGWQNSVRHNLSMNAVCPPCSLILPKQCTKTIHYDTGLRGCSGRTDSWEESRELLAPDERSHREWRTIHNPVQEASELQKGFELGSAGSPTPAVRG